MNVLHNGCCIEYMKPLADGSVDHVITDPPYLYLDHKLDRQFDEEAFFTECKRVIKKTGSLVFFGRAPSVCKWVCICDALGFKFKEELVWDKKRISTPCLNILRKHEMAYVFGAGSCFTINKVKIDVYADRWNKEEAYKFERDLRDFVNKMKSIETGEEFLEWRHGNYTVKQKHKHKISGGFSMTMATEHSHRMYKTYSEGLTLQSIIACGRDHYTAQHPTQKPVELMQYLIKLVSKEGEVVLDPFMGGGSTGVACRNLNRQFIGCEIDEEYYNIAANRIEKEGNYKPSLFSEEQL